MRTFVTLGLSTDHRSTSNREVIGNQRDVSKKAYHGAQFHAASLLEFHAPIADETEVLEATSTQSCNKTATSSASSTRHYDAHLGKGTAVQPCPNACSFARESASTGPHSTGGRLVAFGTSIRLKRFALLPIESPQDR